MKSKWSPNDTLHIPVLVDQVIQYLDIHPDGFYLDGTVGQGGHALAIVTCLSSRGVLLGLDSDEEAIERCKASLRASSLCHLFHASYHTFPRILESLMVDQVDGILLDLGVSSLQLDSPDRGFSYRFEGPLDMRFDRNNKTTAGDIINRMDVRFLSQLIRDFGEEQRAAEIARKIVRERDTKPIATTSDLREVIGSVVGEHRLNKTLSRVFQALRITVNDELRILQHFLDAFISYLKVGGRIVVISYQSLEDRLVKRKFKELEKGCICPPSFPVCKCNRNPSLKILTKNPVVPSEREIEHNHRARSAKLRAGKKIA